MSEERRRIAPYIVCNEDGSGYADIRIAAEDLIFYVDFIWQFGNDVKITGPVEAMTYMKQKIESMRLLYC
ncbi:WYL domain-containing protein [Paenibacillus tyrfis]|uniref:WYL domain-containing protein n=1 Tax=Paenibacillus tyrfis TaxID=1501230 RepID=UPI0020A00549|nr:WYL domain-containing protein [Paenibacillus tyrfis]MCP1308084.1 hypothetical protein [Paenibacillus tyrfis]